jgi:hypothetical protein
LKGKESMGAILPILLFFLLLIEVAQVAAAAGFRTYDILPSMYANLVGNQ